MDSNLMFTEYEIIDCIVKYYKQVRDLDVLVELIPKRSSVCLDMWLDAKVSYMVEKSNRMIKHIEMIPMYTIEDMLKEMLLKEGYKVSKISVSCDYNVKNSFGMHREYVPVFKGIMVEVFKEKDNNNGKITRKRSNIC